MEYPKCLYRKGDAFEWDGRWFDGLTVETPEAEEAARADGWADAAALTHPLDHDGDGKPGGSRKRKPRAAG